MVSAPSTFGVTLHGQENSQVDTLSPWYKSVNFEVGTFDCSAAGKACSPGRSLWTACVRVRGFGFRISGFRPRILGFGFQILVFGIRISGFGFRISGSGFLASGFGFWDSGSRSVASPLTAQSQAGAAARTSLLLLLYYSRPRVE